jgi:bleomycin hydrolase
MKKEQLLASLFLLLLPALTDCNSHAERAPKPAARKSNYIFSPVMELPALPVISQGRSGTCWSFSTTSFLETEIIRIKGEKIDLSEMYFVRGAYLQKVRNYVLRQGTARFTEGGLNHDPILSAIEFGVLPQTTYTGLRHGETEYNHAKMFEVLETKAKSYAIPENKLGAAWKTVIPAVLDSFMGKVPAEFQYQGNTYNPASFLAYTQLVPEHYVTITSFSHVPFYKPFVLSIPANWAYERFYNLPLDELIANIDHALEAGFSLALDHDGTEPTFSGEQGLAVLPENEADKELILTDPRPEKQVTQEMRQEAFENFSTTDDHLMHIVGKVKDQHGNIYYKAKNSWGPTAGRAGFFYLSIPYIRMKAISVLLHKDGLIEATKRKIGM